MSTSYAIEYEQVEQLNFEGMHILAKAYDFTVERVPDPPQSWVAHQNEENYVHLYFVDNKLIEFERFGANDPTWFINVLEDLGLTVVSEHDQ